MLFLENSGHGTLGMKAGQGACSEAGPLHTNQSTLLGSDTSPHIHFSWNLPQPAASEAQPGLKPLWPALSAHASAPSTGQVWYFLPLAVPSRKSVTVQKISICNKFSHTQSQVCEQTLHCSAPAGLEGRGGLPCLRIQALPSPGFPRTFLYSSLIIWTRNSK